MGFEIAVIVVASIIIYLVWERISYTRNLKASRGKVWARFYNEIGEAFDVMCPVQGNILMAPRNVLDKMRAKPGMENADYIVSPDNTYSMPWPPGKPARVQVKVHHVAYYEGVSTPIITRSADKRLSPGAAFTPEMVANIRNEKFTELTVKFIAGTAAKLEKLEAAMGLNPRITQIAVIALIGIAGYGAWRAHEAVMLLWRVVLALGA